MDFDIRHLPFRIWDILDILIVGFLIYQIYKLLKGSIAFNIFVGVFLLTITWWLVKFLDMVLLSMVLGQFVSVGVIIIIIIFQPEVRRFLLMLGNTTLRQRSKFLDKLLARKWEPSLEKQEFIDEIESAVLHLSKHNIGALLVLSDTTDPVSLIHSGHVLDANINKQLLIAIFQKKSPLHDGAVVISGKKIHMVNCILPVSENDNLPQRAGLRHRAGLGAIEGNNMLSIIISEESGEISYAQNGRLKMNVEAEELSKVLTKVMI